MNSFLNNIFPSGPSTEIKSINDINFSSTSATNDVMNLLNANLTNAKVCEDCLKSITVLLSQSNNRAKFLALDTVARIVKVIFLHVKAIDVVEWGIRSLRIFSADENALDKIFVADGCKILAIILKYYSSNSAIVEEVCHTIYNLTLENDECKDAFREYGVIEILTLSIFIENGTKLPQICIEWCLRAIGGLARRNENNKIAFSSFGICEKLLSIIDKIISNNKTNSMTSNVAFAEAVCWAIGNLSYPDDQNQSRLCSNGACEYVVNVMNQYIENSMFVQECFRAIRNLCYHHEINLQKFADLKLCEFIIIAVSFHIQKGIQISAVKETLSDKVNMLSNSGVNSQFLSSLASMSVFSNSNEATTHQIESEVELSSTRSKNP